MDVKETSITRATLSRLSTLALGGISLAAVLILAACGSTSSGAANPGSSATSTPTPIAAVVHTAQVSVKGTTETVLTDAKGFSLYFFTPDTAGTVACTGACAKVWPPLMATSSTLASDHGLPGKLGVINGPNGMQVTYNSHPLYTFAHDMAPGQANGEGLLGKWFVAKPDTAAQ